MPEVEAHSSDLLHLRSSFGQLGVDGARLADDVLRSAEVHLKQATEAARGAQSQLRSAEAALRDVLRQAEGPSKASAIAECRRQVEQAKGRADRVVRAQRRIEDASKSVQTSARTYRQEISRQVPEAEAVLAQLAEDALHYEKTR